MISGANQFIAVPKRFTRVCAACGTGFVQWLSCASQGWRNDRGVVAIEAALIFPVMIFFIFGTVEIYQYYRTAAVMERAAFTVADALSVQKELQEGGPCDKPNHVCTYGQIMGALMQPVDYQTGGHLIIRLFKAETKNNNPGHAQHPDWTFAWGKKCVGSGVCKDYGNASRPQNMPPATDNDTIIVVQAFQNYTPFSISSALWDTLSGETTLDVTVFYRPRFSDLVNLN